MNNTTEWARQYVKAYVDMFTRTNAPTPMGADYALFQLAQAIVADDERHNNEE